MRSIDLAYHRLPDRVSHFIQEVLFDSPEMLITRHRVTLQAPLVIEGRPVLDTGYVAIWCILMGASYDLGCMYTPEGRFSGYYCDIILPPRRSGRQIFITDLCLDLWVSPQGQWTVLDEEEFAEARRRGWIDEATARQARETLNALIRLVMTQSFPPAGLGALAQTPQGSFRSQKGAEDVARCWNKRRSSSF